MIIYPYTRGSASRAVAALAAVSIALGLASGVASSFHDAKAVQVAKADMARYSALVSTK